LEVLSIFILLPSFRDAVSVWWEYCMICS